MRLEFHLPRNLGKHKAAEISAGTARRGSIGLFYSRLNEPLTITEQGSPTARVIFLI